MKLPERICFSKLSDGTKVSTVYLGRGVFETCVFHPNGDSDIVARYDNMQDAVSGHRKEVDSKELIK